jgi:glycine/D-amino acid oxidase-like deaminating enzyme
MPPSAEKAESFWVATVADHGSQHPPLKGDVEIDVAVVGAGIVGLTAALLLLRGGRRVAVLEALQVGRQVSGRSTAKITSQHGLIYETLERSFGEEGAQAYGAANEAGLAQIVRFAEELGIECDLARISHSGRRSGRCGGRKRLGRNSTETVREIAGCDGILGALWRPARPDGGGGMPERSEDGAL